MNSPSWFATITRPGAHLVATIAVWSWFIIALFGAAALPEAAGWLQGSSAAGIVVWYLRMMDTYRSARRPKAGQTDE